MSYPGCLGSSGVLFIMLQKSDDTIMDNKSNDVGVKVESSAAIENKEVEVNNIFIILLIIQTAGGEGCTDTWKMQIIQITNSVDQSPS
jgi:hypothetical protein